MINRKNVDIKAEKEGKREKDKKIQKKRRHHYENREKEAWKTAQTQGYGV